MQFSDFFAKKGFHGMVKPLLGRDPWKINILFSQMLVNFNHLEYSKGKETKVTEIA